MAQITPRKRRWLRDADGPTDDAPPTDDAGDDAGHDAGDEPGDHPEAG